MARDYAAGMPVGNNGAPVSQNTPAPFKAVKQYFSANGTASSVITFTQDTTAIEIATGGTAVVMRWVNVADTQASVTTANFDHAIPAGNQRRFVIPIEAQYQTNPNASAVGANTEYGLFKRVAYQNVGVGSVFVSEYGSSNSY